MEAVIANVTNPGSVGFKCAGIWHFLQGCGTIGIVIRVVDMGPDAPGFVTFAITASMPYSNSK